ncbi:integral membrane protein-like protein [Lindgomyces ingoldianus]|uniref:Integral membrane protein-like protein n=1 Tax=Lindgomyces ingoldianus TaxID=673940 RepID=A0ACB6R5B2_9PLEO|nr:integral membrane protein-like protein [Lindgomyces ingoldianus]KAF2474341.1 integral membrane protein-like protein [Lindgomyces ingoldianus]
MVEAGIKSRGAALVLLLLTFAVRARAHEHHMDNIEEGQSISGDPIDSILWIHILVQALAWGVLFPTGMVLGIIRSKWHVPVQTTGTVLAIVGYFLGHGHKGRQFASNIHSKFVPIIMLLLIIQVAMGVYLKLHLERGIYGKIRKIVVKGHGVVGKLMPIVTWAQFVFGGITALGFCRGDHTGQCLAHFIMGGAFIAYGVILTILLLVGQLWLRRSGRSQEFFDSLVIAAWGCVNTFTEHRWGGPWVHNDLQHTSMGIIWWCAGLVGIWLSRTRDGRPKRNLIPGIVILLTGYGMSAHPQTLPLSNIVHTLFGYTLMAAGVTRIIEIAFVLKDRNATTADGSDPSSFQYLPPFLLYASGFLFMGATEEQMQLLSDAHVSHVSYVLILYSISFLLFLFVNMLLHLYAVHAWGMNSKSDAEAPRANGMPNGHARVDRQVRDAEEFELEGLMSEDEAQGPVQSKEGRPLAAQH